MKKFFSVLMFLAMFFTLQSIVDAESITTEDTIVIELPRNDSTNFSMPLKYDYTNIVDATDSRVYKVALGMNSTEKLTLISKKTFDVMITDQDGNIIVQRSGIGRDGFYNQGTAQVEFTTSVLGDYYIYITPSEDGRNSYPYSLQVLAGEPMYHYSNPDYRVDLSTSSITSSKTTSSIQYFDLSNVSSIPNDAILTDFMIGGTETNRYLLDLYSIKRSLRPDSTFTWIDATYPLYSSDELDYVPKNSQIRVKQSYAFKMSATFYSTGTYSLKPYIMIGYKREIK